MQTPFYNSSDNQDELLQYEEITKRASKSRAPPKPVLQQVGLISRQQELVELGAPDTRSGCVGCWQLNGMDFGSIPQEDLVALRRTIQKTRAHSQQIELALYIEERYSRIRQDVNSRLGPGERPLPDWRAASILNHLRHHNTDAESQNTDRKYELQELIQIALHASVVRNPETGDVSIDDKQGKMYLEYIKALDNQNKIDLSKSNGYTGGAYADSKDQGGPIVMSGRKVLEYWRSKQ